MPKPPLATPLAAADLVPVEQVFAMPANHLDNTPVPLTPDQHMATLKTGKDCVDALSYLLGHVRHKTLTVSTRFNSLGIAESYVKRLSTLLGGDDDRKQSKDNDDRCVLRANQEVARLQRVLAATTEGLSLEAVSVRLQELTRVVSRWWREMGFSYVPGEFKEYGSGTRYHANFRCWVEREGHGVLIEDEPVTAQETHQGRLDRLREHVELEGDGGTLHVLDTPGARKFLVAALRTRFPGATVWEMRSTQMPQKPDVYYLREIEVWIPLPAIPERTVAEEKL